MGSFDASRGFEPFTCHAWRVPPLFHRSNEAPAAPLPAWPEGFRCEPDFALQVLLEVRRRVDAGQLTGASLARRSGISQPHIASWLMGRRRLSVWGLGAVLLALRARVSIEWERAA